MESGFLHLAYFVASVLFILGLRDLTHPDTARRGTNLAAIGMLIAVVGTLAHNDIVDYKLIAAGLILGSLIGIPMGLKIPMTMMPERIALSHAFGGLAVALVGVAEFVREHGTLDAFHMSATGFEVLFGAITFTGSLMAFGKLNGSIPGKPITFPGQNAVTGLLMAACIGIVIYLIGAPGNFGLFYGVLAMALLLGILLVLPIGGADMPVVICLLNSYAGLAACASGFALSNPVLIVTGSLDGGSGFILAMVMSKAMNRSFTNVLFGAFGSDSSSAAVATTGKTAAVNQATVEEAVEVLKYADNIIVVPIGGAVAIGEALGEEIHNDDEPYYSNNGSNQHRVKFPVDESGSVRLIARTDLGEDLQRRLKIRITIADLREFAEV
ncbi:MAG: NAD(P)(+) transhydrogenase (Re/Si-specific) subunit beta, partial [bacterium]